MSTAAARNLEQPWWYSRSTACSCPLRPAFPRRRRRRRDGRLWQRAVVRAGEVLALAAVLGSFLGSVWLLGS
ncbi:MAG TPA: hypothetical protein VNO81_11455 [Candidatus Nitrosotenuis sp.]|jgi:hypothetical protein|nr:hypothetical protein [Candidatus Nitrosotenuis sp.]